MEAINAIADIFKQHSNQPNTPAPRVPSAPTPRVPITAPRRSARIRQPLPRVPAPPITAPPVQMSTSEEPPHRYPTRHIILQTQDELHAVQQLLNPNTPTTIHQWANAIIDPDTGASMEYRHLIKDPRHTTGWTRSFASELGLLAQGIGDRETGTNTVFFIPHNKVPPDRRKDVTYGRICIDYRPHKQEPNRTRLTVGGNLVDFPGDVSTPTAGTTTAKLIINSTISMPNAQYMCANIKHFYLGTPMVRFEYMRLPITSISQEFIDQYKLIPMVHNGHVYMEIQRAMYGLPQAGIIANQLLTRRLAPHGYEQCQHAQGLWRHKWRPILFSLVVDDFGIKYVGKQHADHLIKAIGQHYEYSTN
jgi:hypothetical protein